MVEFSSYQSPMDRDYGKANLDDSSTNDVGIGVDEVGMSVPMGIAAANVQGVSAKIRAGAGNLEIGFPGAVRGNRNAMTPGMFGKEQRQAMKELSEVNEVNLTTHASYSIMGLAGQDQQGNFSEDQRKMTVDEVRRAIDFAADATQGGSVVVHTGEFQRPVSEQPWAKKDGKYQFKMHEHEPEEAVVRVVDDRTGQIMQTVRKSQKVSRPVWLRNERGEYVDYDGNPVDRANRVPEFDPEKGRFKVKPQGWDEFISEAKELNQEFKQKHGRDPYGNEIITPEEAFIRATLETNAANSRGWALYYSRDFEDNLERIKKLKKAKEVYEKLEKATDPDEKWRLKHIAQRFSDFVPPESKYPTEMINKQINDLNQHIEQAKEAAASQEAQARDAMETMDHIKTSEKYALDRSFESYAEAGMHAWNETKRHKDLKKPIMITMENIFPESYGSHPEELKTLITGSRTKMANMLKQKGMSENEAKKAAETHIKATIDTGHMNMWRKYWQGDPKKSVEENERAFNKWMLKNVEDLAKKKMIGNVHLTDNYGYQDEHLSPGQGNTPVKEVAQILKKHGYEDALTVEPGADASTDLSDFHGLMKTWKLFGSPVYSAHVSTAPQQKRWGDVQYSYFGQAAPPYFVFGSYSPSQDWTLWSQAPLE